MIVTLQEEIHVFLHVELTGGNAQLTLVTKIMWGIPIQPDNHMGNVP